MIERAARVFPADVLHLARLTVSLRIAVGLGRVVIIPGLGGPLCGDLRVEGPIRQVEAVDGVGEGAALETIGRKPAAAIPGVHFFPHVALTDLERQDALWADRRLDFVVRNERG